MPHTALQQPAPPPATPLKLGTRSSPLAMVQAREAAAKLCAAHGWAADRVEIIPVLASGDKVQDRPLAELGGKALWTKELDHWLISGEIDLAAHCLKDMETIRPAALAIAAMLEREDPRDCLLGAASLHDLPHGATLGTSAPRRAAQALHLRPDLRIVPFRGNVATRLGKLAHGEADATLLAMAGLNRLGLADLAGGTAPTPSAPLAAPAWLPACGQAIVALECRAEDRATAALLAPLDHRASHLAGLAERALLAALGGNCHSAIGVQAQIAPDEGMLTARLFSPDGQDLIEGQTVFAINAQNPDLSPITALAHDLLAKAPRAIAQSFNPAAP